MALAPGKDPPQERGNHANRIILKSLFSLVVVAVISSLVSADVTCPDSQLSCPSGKTCCFAYGKYACCDLLDDDKIRPGFPSHDYLNSTLQDPETQAASIYDYCPYTSGQKICCDQYRVTCIAKSDCCTNGKCCYRGSRCCGNGQWCCTKPLKCGAYYMSCYSSAFTFAPSSIATLAAIAMACFNAKSYFI